MDKELRQLQLSHTVGINVQWYGHFEKQFHIFSKGKHIFTLWFTQSTPMKANACTRIFIEISIITANNKNNQNAHH